MQRFFDNSLASKFIKYLLANTPLPSCSIIYDGELMLEGNVYLYGNKIVKCTKSGFFAGDSRKNPDFSKLYVSNYIRATDKEDVIKHGENENSAKWTKLTATDDRLYGIKYDRASYFTIMSYDFGESVPGVTRTFVSNRGYYDTDTHMKLGQYLRVLASCTGLDLMPLYNCYCDKYLTELDISAGYFKRKENPNYKVTAIPIKFNTKYTVALTNPTTTYITSTFLKDDRVLMQRASKPINKEAPGSYAQVRGLSDEVVLESDIDKYSGLSFHEPITIEVSNTDPELQKLEKYLYLIIQLPIEQQTKITVLEGRYTADSFTKVYDASALEKSTQREINSILCSGVSLLRDETGLVELKEQASIAFSDKLIEYLLLNTIDNRTDITENVELAQRYFGTGGKLFGVWSQKTRSTIYSSYLRFCKTNDYGFNDADILGYVDSDVEQLINKGLIKPWQ